MEVTVKFATTLGKAAGFSRMTVDADGVGTLIKTLQNAFKGNPDFLKQMKLSNLIVNDTNVNYLDGKRTRFGRMV